MVKSIIIQDGDNTFYGMREAGYKLPLDSPEKRLNFVNDVLGGLEKINQSILGDYTRRLYIQQGSEVIEDYKLKLNPEQKEIFMKFLENPDNIFIKPSFSFLNDSGNIFVNIVSTFCSREEIAKSRIMKILGNSIPNDIVKFDPTFFYELGTKHGVLTFGEDFDITLTNYRRIKK